MSEHVDETTETAVPPARAHHGPTPKEYIRVGIILGVLTALEVWLSYSGIPHAWLVAMLFTAAVFKFVMVVAYFMHLKYDDRRYARFFVMGIAGAATLYLIVLLAFKVFSG